MTTTIFVCDTCRFSQDDKVNGDGVTGGEILAGLIEQHAAGKTDIEVRRQSCLMGCQRHCNTAITAEGKLTYVLGQFEPTAESADAVVEYAGLHAASETGRVPFKQWPQGVKGHFVARIPALGADDAE